MTISCPNQMIMYLLPMMLGRTFDIQTNRAGIDIFREADLKKAQSTHYRTDEVESDYMMITKSSDKRDFLGISGDLALKISSGLVEVKGAGEYLQDTSNSNNSVEMLIRLRFKTMLQKIEDNVKPMSNWWPDLPKNLVGTHVVTSVLFGGEVYASVKFIATKDEYLENITASANLAFKKEGAFNVDASGQLEKVAQNVSSMARMDIVYFANVPLSSVPSTLEGLKKLVADFSTQVKKLNDGNGVAICVELTPLSQYTPKSTFQFNRNGQLDTAMADFNHKFDNLREAKTLLKEFVATLPDTYPVKDMTELIQFSKSLNDVIEVFHKTIGNLDLEKGAEQLDEAIRTFRTALHDVDFNDNNRYTTTLKKLKERLAPKEDTTSPRGVYVRWGKRSCGPKADSILYIGYIASFPEKGIGGGTFYQCIAENPQMSTDLHTSPGARGRESSLSAVRYKGLWMYPKNGQDLNDKVASCSVCQSLLRPTVRMFAAAEECPGDWTLEYRGFLASTYRERSRTEFICLDSDVDVHQSDAPPVQFQAFLKPTQVGGHGLDPAVWRRDASLPCVVCTK